MPSLVTATLRVRRVVRSGAGAVLILAFAALVVLGAFREPFAELAAEHALLAALIVGFALAKLAQRLKARDDDPDLARFEIELGLSAVVATHAFLGPFGGLDSPLHPVSYAVVALFAAFARRGSALVVVAFAAIFEATLWSVGEARPLDVHLAVRLGFVVGFGFLNAVLARAEIARIRDAHRRELESDREKMRSDSRMFRLSSGSSRSESDEDRLYQSSVDEVHHALFHVLRMLHQALDLHTAALLSSTTPARRCGSRSSSPTRRMRSSGARSARARARSPRSRSVARR